MRSRVQISVVADFIFIFFPAFIYTHSVASVSTNMFHLNLHHVLAEPKRLYCSFNVLLFVNENFLLTEASPLGLNGTVHVDQHITPIIQNPLGTLQKRFQFTSWNSCCVSTPSRRGSEPNSIIHIKIKKNLFTDASVSCSLGTLVRISPSPVQFTTSGIFRVICPPYSSRPALFEMTSGHAYVI